MAGLLNCAPQSAQAQVGANINLSPRRLVFEANARASTVLVFNTGAEPATYNIELVDRIMTPAGAVLGLADAPKNEATADAVSRLKSAREMVSFTPRRVVLAPGETQTIRIRIQRSADLPAGEYRTHLTVTAVPPPDQGLTADQAATAADANLSVRLTPLFSISIPVVIRQGPPQIGVEFENLAYRTAGAGEAAAGGVMTLDIVRKGASSLYGDIEVRGADRASKPLGALGGVAVYPEIDRRTVQVPLARAPAKGDQLNIVFRDEDTTPGQITKAITYTVK
jgi:hypothetical protein